MFVVVNMVLQVSGCCMILIRKYVTVAVAMLFGIILLQVRDQRDQRWVWCVILSPLSPHQTVTYTVLWDFRFFMR